MLHSSQPDQPEQHDTQQDHHRRIPPYDVKKGGHYGASAYVARNGGAPPAHLYSGQWSNVTQGLTDNAPAILSTYWKHVISHLEDDNHDYKFHHLPLARVKKVMKCDPDVKMISTEAPILLAKASDVFITELAMRAWIHAQEKNRRTLQRSDIAAALFKSDMYDFLIDIVPREEALPNRRSSASTNAHDHGANSSADSHAHYPNATQTSGVVPGTSAPTAANAAVAAAAAGVLPPPGMPLSQPARPEDYAHLAQAQAHAQIHAQAQAQVQAQAQAQAQVQAQAQAEVNAAHAIVEQEYQRTAAAGAAGLYAHAVAAGAAQAAQQQAQQQRQQDLSVAEYQRQQQRQLDALAQQAEQHQQQQQQQLFNAASYQGSHMPQAGHVMQGTGPPAAGATAVSGVGAGEGRYDDGRYESMPLEEAMKRGE